jgi:transcriptional antiterminator RfaH
MEFANKKFATDNTSLLEPGVDVMPVAMRNVFVIPDRGRTTDMNWYCVHTKPLKEAHVERYCQETLGLDTYFPRLKREKTIRRVKRLVLEPLFPRYLFCRFDPAVCYRAVRYAQNAISIVSFGENPTIVSDETIAQLKSWAGEAVDVISIQPGLRPGDPVQITDGPMQGLRAVFQHDVSTHDRVAILLSVMDTEARMIINRSQIEPTDSNSG